MENEEELIQDDCDYFKASFNRQDITFLPSFKKWKEEKIKKGKKIVKCPWCFGYEVFVRPSNYKCSMCNKSYCQQCLQKCVEDVVELDHRRGCWAKFCGLVAIMIDWTKKSDATTEDYFKTILIFIFGNHILYSYKYYDFLKKII